MVMKGFTLLNSAWQGTRKAARVFVRDVGSGMLEISHNGLAAVGLAVVAFCMVGLSQDSVRVRLETEVLGWLKSRAEIRELALGNVIGVFSEPSAADRVAAVDPATLPKQQAEVSRWLAKRYRVATEPVAALVKEAWHIGQKAGMDPTLILAVVAIESSFNPFAQSHMGAQGLMQVMTRVHDDKYEAFGGERAAFDPLTNLRVGVQVLKDCIARAGGDAQAGLKAYVGAGNQEEDGGYADKVLGEQGFIQRVAGGAKLPTSVRMDDTASASGSAGKADIGKPPTPAPAGNGAKVALLNP
jgi:Transglycosylase SLT domain